ncbi:helix-turn-helix domain-containing protein [Leeuwenhoekiella sp. A16]|uniref:TetR/AcrR family transcriptional regulator n=1 Tax=unclassified Leeuwenhoekiella TaxID=2615029 RepID=UPI003A800AB3
MTDKKTLILSSAVKLFVQNGFDRVSTAEISKTAGVATGTMFYHFKSKEDIIISSYKAIKKEIISQTYLSDSENITIKEELKQLWQNIILWSLDNQDKVQYLLQFKNSPYYCNDLMAEDDTWKGRLEWWKNGIENGVFKQIPLDFLLKTFNDLLFGTIEYLMHHDKEIKKYIDMSFTICWDSVRENNL